MHNAPRHTCKGLKFTVFQNCTDPSAHVIAKHWTLSGDIRMQVTACVDAVSRALTDRLLRLCLTTSPLVAPE